MTARWVLLLVVAAGCASGRVGDGPNGGQHDAPPGSPKDAPTKLDAKVDPPKLDARMMIDAPVMIDAPGGGGGGGLDPDLELPASTGQVCDEPGRGVPECPAGEVCRFYTSTEGRCEGCTTCGNLNAPCSATDQCDILFECYKGSCTNFCTLGSMECGPVADCINIGHATRGVCRV